MGGYKGKSMKRYTRTKLEKLLYIHDCRVDQIVDGACSKLDDVAFDLTVKPMLYSLARSAEIQAANTRQNRGLSALVEQGRIAQAKVWLTQEAAGRQGANGFGFGLLGAH